MDATLKRVVKLLDASQPAAVRLSATVVLAELTPPDADVHSALEAALDDADPAVRMRAIQAIGKLKIAEALPKLLARVEHGGDEASEAAHAAAKLGAKGSRALQDLMPKVSPGLRRYIAAALGSAGTASADAAAVEFLLDSDPGVVASAVRSLVSQAPTLSAAKKSTLAHQLLQHLKDAKTVLPAASQAAAIRLLAAVGDARAEPVLWERTMPPAPAEIRVAALQALGGMSPRPNKDQLKRLFACAVDPDFRIAAPALMMLQHQSASDKTLDDWLGLFRAADVAVRRLALEKLADHDSPAVAEAMLPELGHPDRAFRDAVRDRLIAMKSGHKALQAALFDADTPETAWSLARIVAPMLKNASKPPLDSLFAEASKHLEANDRRGDAFVFVHREIDPADLRTRLEEKAVALRKKKNYDGAMAYLRLLARDPAIGFDLRFELAGVGLKLSSKELSPEARGADPCLGQFSHLVSGYENDLTRAIDKAKWLEPEDLFYLGFHFIERDGVPRRFGTAVLQSLVKRSPKSKLAKDAKSKLKAAGV